MIFRAPKLRRIRSADDFAQIPQALDRALAVRGLVTDDQSALVVLNRTGQNLAGTGAELADHDDQRTVPGGTAHFIAVDLDAVIETHHLDDRPLVNEQAGQIHGFDQAAAAVAAEIEHHGIDALGLEVLQDLAHIGRRAAEVLGAILCGLHVLIEARQIHDAHFHRRTIGLRADFKHLAMSGFVFQFDLGPRDLVRDRLVRARGNHVPGAPRCRHRHESIARHH